MSCITKRKSVVNLAKPYYYKLILNCQHYCVIKMV